MAGVLSFSGSQDQTSFAAPSRLHGLDALRGVAAICVLFQHVFAGLASNAYLAVDFFFMLSGYIMARRFEADLRSGGAAASRHFMAARIERLVPLVLLGSLLGLPWLVDRVGIGAAVPVALACLLMLPIDGPEGPYMLNPPAWSIFYELVANALHALLLARLPTRTLVMIGAFLFVTLAVTVLPHGLGFMPSEGNRVLVGIRALVPYIFGIVLYRRCQYPMAALGALLRGSPAVLLIMPAWFLFGTFVTGPVGAMDFLFVALICPLLIAAGLAMRIDARVAACLGALSFPLYAVHGPVVLSLQALDAPAALQIAASLGVAAALVPLSQHLTQRRKRRRAAVEAVA